MLIKSYIFNAIILVLNNAIYNGELEFFRASQLTNIELQEKNHFSKYQDRNFVKNLVINQCYKKQELNKENKLN